MFIEHKRCLLMIINETIKDVSLIDNHDAME